MLSSFWPSSATTAAYTPDPWERQVVAACLVLEASGEGTIGLIAVANVISNRGGGDSRRFYRVVIKPYVFLSLNAGTEGKTGGRGYAPLVTKASRNPN